MAFEKSFHLFEGFSYDMGQTNDEESGPSFQVGDVDMGQWPTSSEKVKSVLDFLKGKGAEYTFLFLPVGDANRDYFNIGLKLEVIAQICDTLPDPFLRVVIKDATDPIMLMLNDSVVVDERIRLKSSMRKPSVFKQSDEDPPSKDDRPSDIWMEYKEGLVLQTGLKGDCSISVYIGWEEPKIKPCTHSFLQRLFEAESTKDLALIAGNGTEFKCHRNIFSAHAEAFSAMLSATTGMTESQTGRIQMNENTEDGLRHLLRYIYGMELAMNDISLEATLELFQTAHKYGLTELEQSLVEFFMGKGVTWFSPDSALELYLYVKDLKALDNLREHMLYVLASADMEGLRSCELFTKLEPAESLDITFKIIRFFQDNNCVPKPNYIDNPTEEEDGDGDGCSSAKRRREN